MAQLLVGRARGPGGERARQLAARQLVGLDADLDATELCDGLRRR